MARLLSESRWLLFAGLGVYLVLILATYHRADPGWSHDGGGPAVANAGGRFGAWCADLLLYVFGISAWWWVALFSYLVIARSYKRMADRFLGNDATVLDRRSMFALVRWLSRFCCFPARRWNRYAFTA